MMRLVAIGLTGTPLCAASRRNHAVRTSSPHLGPFAMSRSGNVSSGYDSAADRGVPTELTALARAADALHLKNERDHGAIVLALRRLADALALVAERGGPQAAAIRDAADSLASSAPQSLLHENYLRQALGYASETLARSEPRRFPVASREYGEAITALTDASMAIDPDVPLLHYSSTTTS